MRPVASPKASLSRSHGAATAVAAAPFVPETICPLLPHVDLLVVNAIEFAQLCNAMGADASFSAAPEHPAIYG